MLNDYLLKHLNNLTKHARNFHHALRGARSSPVHGMPYKVRDILLHCFLGEQKAMVIQYTASKVFTEMTSDLEFITLYSNALKQFPDWRPKL